MKSTLKFTEVKVNEKAKPMTHLMRMGGYWYIDRYFPFIHFEKEYIIIGNETKLYKWEKK